MTTLEHERGFNIVFQRILLFVQVAVSPYLTEHESAHQLYVHMHCAIVLHIKNVPTMPALCLILDSPYYALNYAGIMGHYLVDSLATCLHIIVAVGFTTIAR